MKGRKWLLVALAVACGPLTTSAPPSVAYNTCPCNNYDQSSPPACNAGICTVSQPVAAPTWTLVVSLPETNFFAPNLTFAVPLAQVGPQLLQVVANVGGEYRSDPRIAQLVNYDLKNAGLDTSLPVSVSYRPVVPSAERDAGYIDTTASGLPLLLLQGGPGSFVDAPGPAGGPSQTFAVFLPPGDYERTITPDPPFDQAFPPEVRVISEGPGTNLKEIDPVQLDLTSLQIQLDSGLPQGYPTFTVSRNDAKSLEGWSMYLRDVVTKRKNSTTAVLPAKPIEAITLFTNHLKGSSISDALQNEELVLEPPAGEVPTFPTYTVGEIAQSFATQITYPSVDDSLEVEGAIIDPNGAAAPADVFFYADNGLDKQTGLTDSNKVTFDTNLTYSATVPAPQGVYVANLPPGNYGAVVTPRGPTLAKVKISPFLLVSSKNDSTGTERATPVVLPWQSLVTGGCIVADGRPLTGAEVQATPAVQLLDADTRVPVEEWPRTARTITDSTGRFALELDPGRYDLTVRPAIDTQLPWLVIAGEDLSTPGDKDLGVLSVPAPFVVQSTLVDPGSNVIRYALVQVFAVPAPVAHKDLAAVEIGHTLTDEAGNYALYLTPPVAAP